MTLSRRTSLILIIMGFLFLLGILFRDFLLDNFIHPVALVLWIFWRFLQSFDQNTCWGVLVLGILVFAFYRLIEERPSRTEEKTLASSNATLERMNYWRAMILTSRHGTVVPNIFLKPFLAKMLATLYTSKQTGADYSDIYSALKEKIIPLPAGMHDFLFPGEFHGSRRSIAYRLNMIRQYLSKELRRQADHDIADYYLSIEEVLNYMEKLMEVDHDNP